ncbi:alpha/beta hydrolase [Paracoccus hibiscisoli]|uniref:Palmitoyl-protein thioesterase ABHD10, mitochondrial n=1 Tax=Paracoccus hibiscisoli TaxID=2023261 RepID=A0A4U0QML3_9RHOB|nr:alpha/beta fold hydrolase [Paracoccus hibiscisoli]TJZ83087.1 alpha/beta fold hydrolase [Paracoccus hibiscisoli]
MTDFLTTDAGRRIAYERLDGQGPGVVFLGGFRSDMQGAKALHLREWAAAQWRSFLRFDYSGHGESGGAFEEGCIGDWAADALAAITALTEGPQVLVGSSMGGWISLLIARGHPERVAGLVTIAAAPDFTERGFWAGFSEEQRGELNRDGQVALPSEYGAPLILTRRLIEDGRQRLVLDQPLALPFPVRMLQGTADADVPVSWAHDLLDHVSGDDIRLTLVKGADHRFSSPACLSLIVATIEDVVQNVRL